MNFKKSALASAITLATFATGAAAFDASSWEVSGFVKNETAAFLGSGTSIGKSAGTTAGGAGTAYAHDGFDTLKFENTAKVFVNGDLADNAALHAELNFVYDTEATPNDYQGHMNYSQNDYLRELYVDTMVGDTEVRVGKQQVVWGTADGIKLLDIINPTDYREFAQNTMEDSRIPVWMIKADTYVGDTGSMQFILAQAEENKIAGLNATGDSGHPFIMKGVDSITGKWDGFLNVARDIGATAGVFNNGFASLAAFNASTVGGFINGAVPGFNSACTGGYTACSATVLSGYAVNAGSTSHVIDAALIDATKEGATTSDNEAGNPASAFAYMTDATFATFNAFSGATTQYIQTRPDDEDANFGFRFKDSLDNGLNYSLNYFNHYDSNPYIDMYWKDGTTGERLTPTTSTVTGSTTLIAAEVAAAGGQYNEQETGQVYTTVSLGTNSSGTAVGYVSGGAGSTLVQNAPVLVFEEKLNRIQSLGASFDYTVETDVSPVVLRGEFLYNKDEMMPVVNRNALGYGDLVNGLKMQEADTFKYVLGADVTVLTNMLVSGQFIQFRNLDYVNNMTDAQGNACGSKYNCGVYTGDAATLHMSNGLQKARENKEFYSLFLSKPFGPNQLGRFNNIFMFEEGGGKWNRFDVEYSFSDELVGSFELNNYWGDTNTQFGQMEDSSNIQVGLKYLF
jgi:hypothetical protein